MLVAARQLKGDLAVEHEARQLSGSGMSGSIASTNGKVRTIPPLSSATSKTHSRRSSPCTSPSARTSRAASMVSRATLRSRRSLGPRCPSQPRRPCGCKRSSVAWHRFALVQSGTSGSDNPRPLHPVRPCGDLLRSAGRALEPERHVRHGQARRQRIAVHDGFMPARLARRLDGADAVRPHVGEAHGRDHRPVGVVCGGRGFLTVSASRCR